MTIRDTAGLRALIPQVVSVLVARGADFASAEDAVQAALIDLLGAADAPHDTKAWLIRTSWRPHLE